MLGVLSTATIADLAMEAVAPRARVTAESSESA
jgi:hypothetical protein